MRSLAAPTSRSARAVAGAIALAAAVVAPSGTANAQQPPPAATAPPAAAPTDDVVVLGDDTEVRGRVIDVRRGERVVIRDLAGRDLTYPWSNIRRVMLAPGSSAAPLPLPSGPVAGSGQEALGVDSERARLANRLVVGGAVAWTFGYVLSIIGAAAGLGVGASQQDGHGTSCFKGAPYAFIPVVGAAISAAEYPRHTIMGENGFVGCGEAAPAIAAFAVVDTIVQIGGAGVLIGGLAYGAGASGPAPQKTGGLLVTPGAQGAQAGLTASFRW